MINFIGAYDKVLDIVYGYVFDYGLFTASKLIHPTIFSQQIDVFFKFSSILTLYSGSPQIRTCRN